MEFHKFEKNSNHLENYEDKCLFDSHSLHKVICTKYFYKYIHPHLSIVERRSQILVLEGSTFAKVFMGLEEDPRPHGTIMMFQISKYLFRLYNECFCQKYKISFIKSSVSVNPQIKSHK